MTISFIKKLLSLSANYPWMSTLRSWDITCDLWITHLSLSLSLPLSLSLSLSIYIYIYIKRVKIWNLSREERILISMELQLIGSNLLLSQIRALLSTNLSNPYTSEMWTMTWTCTRAIVIDIYIVYPKCGKWRKEHGSGICRWRERRACKVERDKSSINLFLSCRP